MKKILLFFNIIGITTIASSTIISCKTPAENIKQINLNNLELTVEKPIVKDAKNISNQDHLQIKKVIHNSVLSELRKLNKNITSKDFNIINIDELSKFKSRNTLVEQALMIQASNESKYLTGQTKQFRIELKVDITNKKVTKPHIHVNNKNDITPELEKIKSNVINQIDMFISNIHILSDLNTDYTIENFDQIDQAKTSAQLNKIKLQIKATDNSRYLVGETQIFNIDSHLTSEHK